MLHDCDADDASKHGVALGLTRGHIVVLASSHLHVFQLPNYDTLVDLVLEIQCEAQDLALETKCKLLHTKKLK